MKVVELLNKIANGEKVPKKIKYRDYIYELEEGLYYREDGENITLKSAFHYLYLERCLNDEVEIIEEDKKIEKIKILNCDNYVKKENYETILTMQEIALDINTLRHQINKIIDYLEDKQC